LLPAGPQHTAIRVYWLVDEGAVEGRDYDLAKLMPFWQLTSEQDWLICERQQRGVNSSAYRPGPYSTHKEYNVDGFIRWYLKMVASGADGPARVGTSPASADPPAFTPPPTPLLVNHARAIEC
jgi:Rieske 2Fe-2S family protein